MKATTAVRVRRAGPADDNRGLGIGPMLVNAVLAEARALGLGEVQWQTPPWNTDAIRFYDRMGARAKEKRRYSLSVLNGA